MKRRDPTLLLALVAALVIHLLLLHAGTRAANRDLGWWLATSSAQAKQAADLVVIPPPPPDDMLIGEAHGTGHSINSMPGDQPMQSPVSDPLQEQALASRDPVGFGRSKTAKPLAEVLRGNNGRPSPQEGSGPMTGQSDLAKAPAPHSSKTPPAKPAEQKPAEAPVPASPRIVLVDPKAPNNVAPAENPLQAGPLAAKPIKPSQPKEPQKQQDPQQPQNQQPVQDQGQNQGGGQNGSPDSGAGKPIPSANFESVPITMNVQQMVVGKVTAQAGRKMLTRQIPDLTLAGWIDVSDLQRPVVVLRLKIDETGNVTDVRTIHSSGSDSIDLPCERAAATWWFEPKKDPTTGKPVPDEIQFVITFK